MDDETPPFDPKSLDEAAHPQALGRYLAGLATPGHAHAMTAASVREDHYKGHHIVVETTYRFEVDGRTIDVPVMIDDDGNVHCHSLPNYRFESAVGLVRQLIDTFPGEFPAPTGPPAGGAPGGHDHGAGGGH